MKGSPSKFPSPSGPERVAVQICFSLEIKAVRNVDLLLPRVLGPGSPRGPEQLGAAWSGPQRPGAAQTASNIYLLFVFVRVRPGTVLVSNSNIENHFPRPESK